MALTQGHSAGIERARKGVVMMCMAACHGHHLTERNQQDAKVCSLTCCFNAQAVLLALVHGDLQAPNMWPCLSRMDPRRVVRRDQRARSKPEAWLSTRPAAGIPSTSGLIWDSESVQIFDGKTAISIPKACDAIVHPLSPS